MKYTTMSENPFNEFNNMVEKRTIVDEKELGIDQKIYCQCPVCGILCKTKDAYLKHTAKHIERKQIQIQK